MLTSIFADHFVANNEILPQIVQNLSRGKLCAVFSGTPCSNRENYNNDSKKPI